MTGALAPRLVLVTRETEYDQLLVRHATRGQASAFLGRRAQSIDALSDQAETLRAILSGIRTNAPKGWRIASVSRGELDRFLFGPEDVVVAVGQDGLVANVAKYLDGQPVIGVNADPARNPGVLAPHAPDDVEALLLRAAAGTLETEGRTMLRAELDDGQALLALNEVFVGHVSHQSARYVIGYDGREEMQSSSGLIVATGTGATGWALSISRAIGVAVNIAPADPAAMFLVREPWPSQATGADIVAGRLAKGQTLTIVSRMNEGGVVFADGMERDRLDFAWGRTLTVSVATRQLRFIPGRHSPAAQRTVAETVPPPRPAPRPALRNAPHPAPPAPAAVKRKAPLRAIIVLLVAALIVINVAAALIGMVIRFIRAQLGL